MLSHIDRIDPTILKPEPVKTTRDPGKRNHKGDGAVEPREPQPDDESKTPEADEASETQHLIDVRV